MVAVILIGAHLVAEFIFQTEKTAARKNTNKKLLAVHGAVYFLCITAASFAAISIEHVLWPVVIVSLSHVIIDWVKTRFRNEHFAVFIVDQVLHILIIVLVCLLFELGEHTGGLLKAATTKWPENDVSRVIAIALMYLIALTPSAVLVRKALTHMTGSLKKENKDSEKRAGYLIGMLERVFVVTLILVSQWAAIGLILAAKSLARFKQLEEKEFAEVYLIGTLLSVALAVVSTLTLQWLYT